MDCTKTQRLLPDFADGRLTEPVARAVQQHLTDCSDCRVARQRALRLQQLLAVKRYETPGTHYFENFLGEFQRRLAVETAPRPTVWQRLAESLHFQPAFTLRYGFAHALGVMFAVALVWQGISTSDLSEQIERAAELEVAPTLVSSSLPAPHSMPRTIASALPARVAEPAAARSAMIIPVGARDAWTAPRYVLDRLTVTPASHEGADVHF